MFGANASKTKGRNSHKVWTKFIEQYRKIDQPEEWVSFQENTINLLLIKWEYIEQYSRRNCLRIPGIESKKSEKIDDVWQKVKE